MGRCYEFGVLVGKGCEHAMVVPDAGGRCECATCAVVCTGKFAACAAITDHPGYVPSTAPAWAVAVGTPAPPTPPPSAPGTDPGPSLAGPPVGNVPGALVEAVTTQLADRDIELRARIDALAEMVDDLRRQSAEQAASLQAALTNVADLMNRLDEARPAPLFGFPRRQS